MCIQLYGKLDSLNCNIMDSKEAFGWDFLCCYSSCSGCMPAGARLGPVPTGRECIVMQSILPVILFTRQNMSHLNGVRFFLRIQFVISTISNPTNNSQSRNLVFIVLTGSSEWCVTAAYWAAVQACPPGFNIQSLGFWIRGLGFRVWGFVEITWIKRDTKDMFRV